MYYYISSYIIILHYLRHNYMFATHGFPETIIYKNALQNPTPKPAVFHVFPLAWSKPLADQLDHPTDKVVS